MYKAKHGVNPGVQMVLEFGRKVPPVGGSNAKREVQFIYKPKRDVNLRVTGGTGMWPEGTPCGRIYNAKREA